MRSIFSLLAALLATELVLRGFLSIRFSPQPGMVQNHPVLGKWFTPNNRFQSDGMTFETDAQGVVKRASLDRKQGPLVFLLGDSFLEGFQVPPDDNLSERLADMFAGGCRCINLGISGGSPSVYWLAYRHFKRVFGNPSAVVVLFNHEFIDEAGLFLGGRLDFDPSGRLMRIKEPVDTGSGLYWSYGGYGVAPFRQYWWEYRGLMQLGILRNEWTRRIHLMRLPKPCTYPSRCDYHDDAEGPAGVERTFRPLLAMKLEADGDGSQMVVLLLPFASRVEATSPQAAPEGDTALEGARSDLARSHMASELARYGIGSLDLLPIFQAHRGPPLFAQTHGHFTQEGHDLVAKEIYGFVQTRLRHAPH